MATATHGRDNGTEADDGDSNSDGGIIRHLVTTPRVLAVAVIALALMFSIGGVGAGIAVADGTSDAGAGSAAETADALERDGGNLTVDISGLETDAEPDRIVVEVTDPVPGADGDEGESAERIRYEENASGAGETVSVDVTAPDQGDATAVSLIDANVTVTAEFADEDDEQLVENASVPLHYVGFDHSLPAWFDDGDLRVPLADDTVGLAGADGETVAVAVSSGGDDRVAEFSAEVRGGGTQLAVSRDDLTGIDLAAPLQLDVRASADGKSVSSSARSLEPELRIVDDELVFWYPLLESGTTYDVDAEDGDGGQSVTAEPDAPGRITLSSVSPGAALSVTVAPAEGDGDGVELSPAGDGTAESFKLEATVADDGRTLSFPRQVGGLGVTDAVLQPTANASDDARVRHVAVDDSIGTDGRLTLAALENGTVTTEYDLLLATDAGVAEVSLEPASDTGASTDDGGLVATVVDLGATGSLLIAPLLIGLGTGAVLSRFDESPTIKKAGLAGLVGFGLALASAVVAIVLLVADPVSMDQLRNYALAGVGLVLGTGGAAGSYYALAARAAKRASGFTATVTVTDGSGTIPGPTTIYYRQESGDQSGSTTIDGGRGQVSVPGRGTWELIAEYRGQRSDIATVSRRNATVTIDISFPTTLTVVDRTDRQPIPDATVRTAHGDRTTTADDGTVTLEPSGEDATEVEIEHEKYQQGTATVTFDRDSDDTVELAPRTGRVRITSSIDGVATESLDLTIVPERDERFLRRRTGELEATTGRDGTAVREDVPVGRYRVELATPDGRSDLFEGGQATLTVREGETATATVDARFTWSLSSDQRARIDRIRDDLQSMVDPSGRDTAIPSYYASVVEAMLEAVEELPDAGHHFVGTDYQPDGVADAVLESAATTAAAINDAMTTKRTLDLFAACADMPDPGIRWRGEYDLAALLERLEDDPTSQRNELKQRYEEVDAALERRRQEVSEIAPAREMHQRAWEMVGDIDRGTEAIVIGYGSLLVLDAVEELFEHDALHERLSRTVF